MNICVIVPHKDIYSETFVRAHIERLPGNVTFLYGGYLPTRLSSGELLLPEPKCCERIRRFLLRRLFKINFDGEALRRRALKEFFKKNQIDVVLAEFGPTGACVADVCRDAGVALVVHFHGFDAYETGVLKEFSGEYQKMFKIAGAIVAVSRHMEQKLIEMGAPKEKVHYNPCGMDEKLFFGSDPSSASPVFLTTGRFVDKKAPHLVLLAFQKVFAKFPQVRLIMVGDGPLFNSSVTLAKTLGIEQAVDFAGVKSHKEVAELMRKTRAFVQHSITAVSGDSEGTPVAVQEAGGSGLPVVATYHGGIPDVIEDGVTGFLVKEGDVEAMAEKMLKLAQDPSLAATMGNAAKKKILSQFTLEKTIERLAGIMAEATGRA